MFGEMSHRDGTILALICFISLGWALGNTYARSLAGLLSCSVA
jgi:hypothetical protein